MSHDAEHALGPGLTNASNESLRQLLTALRSRSLQIPVTAPALAHAGLGHLSQELAPFLALDAQALQLVVGAVLAERARSSKRRLELVWSGSDAGVSYARYTKLVIPELIGSAARQVTIAGYSFDQGAGIFGALHAAMAERTVTVRLFLDIKQLRERLEAQLTKERRKSRLAPLDAARSAGLTVYAVSVLDLFMELHWPAGALRPELYYDPRTADPQPRVYASLHAKCLIVDCERSLITSANFTGRAQDHNIEAGVLIYDKTYAEDLERQWNNLIESGDVVRAQ